MYYYYLQEGQGLGKKEQGMSVALQVEKTSKRGGRIIHEKDGNVMPPPGFAMPSLPGPGIRFYYKCLHYCGSNFQMVMLNLTSFRSIISSYYLRFDSNL